MRFPPPYSAASRINSATMNCLVFPESVCKVNAKNLILQIFSKKNQKQSRFFFLLYKRTRTKQSHRLYFVLIIYDYILIFCLKTNASSIGYIYITQAPQSCIRNSPAYSKFSSGALSAPAAASNFAMRWNPNIPAKITLGNVLTF